MMTYKFVFIVSGENEKDLMKLRDWVARSKLFMEAGSPMSCSHVSRGEIHG